MSIDNVKLFHTRYCAECGKEFIISSAPSEWCYKSFIPKTANLEYFCTYTCWRSKEKKNAEKKSTSKR